MSLRPPNLVRKAMERMQLSIASPQDETLVATWLDFACEDLRSSPQKESSKCGSRCANVQSKQRSMSDVSPFGAKGETQDALAQRIASLYKRLNRPGASRFQTELRKRGISVPDTFVKGIVAEQSSRQLFAAPPKFTGRVVAQHIDERWAADIIDFQSKTSAKDAPVYVLIVQDIFSHFLFAKALRSKVEVEAAFLRIMAESQRKPDQLGSDAGSEFTNRSFQTMLSREGIYHDTKEGPQDLATLDRAIGGLRAALSRRTTDGDPWYKELNAAIEGTNESNHSALYLRAPDEVMADEELRFELRYKNAQMRQENVELSKKRAEDLQKQGAFRTLLKPTTGFRRRAGQQNWSEKIHQVQTAGSGYVTDTDGRAHLMSTVKAVLRQTIQTAAPDFATGGSRKVDERRRAALHGWLPLLLSRIRRAGDDTGLSVQQASRDMASVSGFQAELKNQRATMLQFAQLWPEEIRIEKIGTQNFLFAAAEQASRREPKVYTANSGTLLDFAATGR